MEGASVYFLDDSELAEFESKNKGYRNDVYVKVENEYIKVTVYDTKRLQQDFESEIDDYGYFAIEPNLILVKEVNIEEITKTVTELFKQKYFSHLKSLEIKDVPEIITGIEE